MILDWRGGGKESRQIVEKVAVGLDQSGACGSDEENCSSNTGKKK